MQEFKNESFGLLQKKGKISKKNTKLIDPIDITTLFNTWNNDNGEYGGKRYAKRKTKKRRLMKKTRLMKKSRKSRK
jgi:hypothetical protein